MRDKERENTAIQEKNKPGNLWLGVLRLAAAVVSRVVKRLPYWRKNKNKGSFCNEAALNSNPTVLCL